MDDHGLGDDPLERLRSWVERGREAVPHQDSMTLATATPDGKPSVRVVLLRGIDERGLTFFTNRASRKAEELRLNPRAAAVIQPEPFVLATASGTFSLPGVCNS